MGVRRGLSKGRAPDGALHRLAVVRRLDVVVRRSQVALRVLQSQDEHRIRDGLPVHRVLLFLQDRHSRPVWCELGAWAAGRLRIGRPALKEDLQ